MYASNHQDTQYQTIGILGGGQLAKMLAHAAQKLGFTVIIYEQFPDSPAARVAAQAFVGRWSDWATLEQFARSCDLLTIESEFVPLDTLRYLQSITPIFPHPSILELVQDKYRQKVVVQQCGFQLPTFTTITSIEDIATFANRVGFPFVLKSRSMGYDGYGNAVIHSWDDIAPAFERLRRRSKAMGVLAEAFVPFQKELALLLVRNRKGDLRFYPLVETIQNDGICTMVIAPADLPSELEVNIQQLGQQLAEHLNFVGMMAIELFLLSNGSVLFNELAPRVHNSGHFSIEGCFTSQFENHIRAIADLPLGSTSLLLPAAAMLNILGRGEGPPFLRYPDQLLAFDKISVHIYGKMQRRPRRKMGHITTVGMSRSEVIDRLNQAATLIQW